MAQTITEQISTGDWEATPAAVRNVLLSLERERNDYRERLQRLEQARVAASEEHDRRLRRYQSLVEEQFLHGLTSEQEQEIERLGEEIDTVNSSFYPSLSSLAEIIASHTGQRPK